MYQSVPAATTAGIAKKALWPLAGIICLGVLGLLFAATIILALIPIYTSNKSIYVNTNSTDQPLYLQFKASADSSSSISGAITNTAQVQKAFNGALGSGDQIEVDPSSQVQPGLERRKRRTPHQRAKRGLIVYILIILKIKYKAGCIDLSCRQRSFRRILNALQRPFSNFPISIDGSPFTFSMTFDNRFTSKPYRFGGKPSSFDFVAVSSGLFTDPLTWANGILPYGSCTVTIPAGITVSLPRSALEINVRTFNVRGSLVLGGSAFPSFTFNYPTNIIAYPGGTLQDQTSTNNIYAVPGSLMTIYPGAQTVGKNTVISTYTGSPTAAASNVISSTTIVTNGVGPFTCGLLPSGAIKTFNKVEAIAVTSGDFTSPGTWLGGIVPTTQVATLAGSLGMYVAPGCTLSTAGLNGLLNIPFDTIEVASGAIMQLGTPGLTTGFKFGFPTVLQVQGQIASAVGVASTIFFPVGSAFNLYAGSSFISTGVTITISSFIFGTDITVGTPLILASSQTGPYFVTIPLSGVITISVTVPGTGATTPVTTAASVTGGSMG